MSKARLRTDSDYESRIQHALTTLKSEPTLSIRAAAVRFGVPRSTLRDRHFGKSQPRNQAHKKQQLLTEEEENEVVAWIERLDHIGIPPRLSHIHDMVAVIVKGHEEWEKATVGKHWISRFLDRHIEIASRLASRIDCQRESAAQPASIKSFFDRLGEVKSRYHISADDIWNVDEKGFAIGIGKKGKVVCKRQRRNPRVRHPGNREWVTLMEGVSAGGKLLSPLYIYEGGAHLMGNHDYKNRDDASFGLSNTGWTNNELGFRWLKEVFEPGTRSGNSRLLILDGHSSHLSVEFITFAESHHIYLLCFPSHSTHILQPLDVGLFGPLATYYSHEVDSWSRAHPYQILSKGDFFPLCQKARRAAFTETNIKSAFAATGIYPYRRARVQEILQKVTPPSSSFIQLHPPSSIEPSSAHNSSSSIATVSAPTNAKQVSQLKSLLESSTNIEDLKKIGLALGSAAGSAMAAATIAQETVRQVAAAPKKSKSDRRHISKAKLISRRDLEQARKNRLEKEEKAQKLKETKKVGQAAHHTRTPSRPTTLKNNQSQHLPLPPASAPTNNTGESSLEGSSRSPLTTPIGQSHLTPLRSISGNTTWRRS